ncbi:O-acetyl-ADP-ribose deacetylase [Poriferisphaera corsica]|uniref:O-acetyl-ADP-ribose deacetylase n=1 Tax=Poriferisphaera corsica TaxID=2528020 RepID=A0A517YRV5_9BACT|nr:macro domain-containing protein [Poriferisphaera corsica]QDU32950.1 O-acetyl-ADP-ribose deacetylase [Poriferisphaera corsica]
MSDIPLPQSENDPVLSRIEVLVADITTLNVDVIVNAANESLLGGSGVDGAIHNAAGPELLEHNKTLDGCKTGLAVITPSFNLASRSIKHIIHTVGPIWREVTDNPLPGQPNVNAKIGYTLEDTLLASCYMQALTLTTNHKLETIAFPSIATGVYNFPKPRAAKIAFGHIFGYLSNYAPNPETDFPKKVTICCFSQADADLYIQTIATKDDWMFNRGRI